MAKIIDGRLLAKKILAGLKKEAAELAVKPGLAMVLVGSDSASQLYVAAKEKACRRATFYSKKIVFPAEVRQADLITAVKRLNDDPKIHGILVQLPLPPGLDQQAIVQVIDPQKDVDCFHPHNTGQLALIEKKSDWDQRLLPCTPRGVMRLISSTGESVAGQKAVVVGRSNLTGKPIGLLLLARGATVTFCHSQTTDLKTETRQADILVVAVGQAGLITAEMVKPGSMVIDVGINRVGNRVVGDVDFEAVKTVAGYITPVPGGVGPMTIACLLENTLLLAKQAGIKKWRGR